MSVNLSADAKMYGVFLQLAVLLLIQSSIYLPVLHTAVFPRHGTVKCYHDHRLCGCSPGRIASRTCCCSMSGEAAHDDTADAGIPSCCARKQQAAKPVTPPKDGSPQRFVNAPPCGSDPQFITASLDTIKFIRVAASVPMPDMTPLSFPPVPREIFRSMTVEPPTPPPERSVVS